MTKELIFANNETEAKLDKELVHRRFTLEELQAKLEDIIGESIEISNTNEEGLLPEQDYALDIGSKDSYGYGMIWYAKTRAGQMYITEVTYEEE